MRYLKLFESYFSGLTDKEEIKKRYRKLANELHPDKGGDEEEFKKMQNEYEYINNLDRKNSYKSPNSTSNKYSSSSTSASNKSSSDEFNSKKMDEVLLKIYNFIIDYWINNWNGKTLDFIPGGLKTIYFSKEDFSYKIIDYEYVWPGKKISDRIKYPKERVLIIFKKDKELFRIFIEPDCKSFSMNRGGYNYSTKPGEAGNSYSFGINYVISFLKRDVPLSD